MKTRTNFTFKSIDNISLLQRLCMGFNVSFGLNQMSQYIDENGNPTQKAIDLFAKNIKHAHKSPLFLENIPTFTSHTNIGEKITSSIELAGVDYYREYVNGFYGAFHYTISLYAALVLHTNEKLGFQFRQQIVEGLEKKDIIPVANHSYHLDLFATFHSFVQNTKNLHHSILDNSIGLSADSLEYLGKYRGITIIHTDEVQLKFYKKETI